LGSSGYLIIATRADDKVLKNAKLASKMPENWSGFVDRSEKRYEAAGIQILTTLMEHIGSICR
jgi:hypothetical protein